MDATSDPRGITSHAGVSTVPSVPNAPARTDPVIRRLFIATFLYTFAQAVGVPLVPEFLKLDLGASLLFIGVTLGVYGIMQIVLRLPMGDLADRRGRLPSLLVSFALTFVAGLFLVFAPNKWGVIPGIAFFGLAGGIFWVAANAYLFDRVGTGDIAKATSDYSLWVGFAFLAGPPIGHFVAQYAGFRAAFALFLATSVAGFVLTLTLPEEKPAPRPKPATSPYRRAWVLLRHPALAFSAAGTFLYSLLFSTFTTFFQLHVLAVGLTVLVAGMLLGGRTAASLVVRLRLPAVLRRFGAVRVLFGGLVVTACATAAVPFASGLPMLILVSIVVGFGTGVMIPANLMLVHEGAPPSERGLANGIYGTMLGAGSAAAPVAFGAVGGRLGLAWTFWTAAGVVLLLVLAIAATRTGRERFASPVGA